MARKKQKEMHTDIVIIKVDASDVWQMAHEWLQAKFKGVDNLDFDVVRISDSEDNVLYLEDFDEDETYDIMLRTNIWR